MTSTDWCLIAGTAALALVALALVYLARAIQDHTDVIGHDHDTRWHYDDPPSPAPEDPTTCGATVTTAGHRHTCTRLADHPGLHRRGLITWSRQLDDDGAPT